jgi:hypothetical protein
MTNEGDWRLRGQERYLLGVRLRWQTWEPADPDNDHDHCEFCWVHFGRQVFPDDPDTQLRGFGTEDRVHWICRSCFADFSSRFRWEVVGGVPAD